MPGIQYGLSSFERGRGNLPELPVVNMFVEEAPTETNGVILQSFPGLDDRAADMGIGPVDALFKADGVLDSGLYGVSEGKLYKGQTLIGALDGAGPFSMAGYANKLFVAGGASLWGYDGTTLAAVAFPDGAAVAKVVVGASRLIAIRKDTEKFYWSDPLSSTIGALSFATAENQPDRLRDMVFIDDILILVGAETLEFWPNSPDPLLPFYPLEARVFERGVKVTGCITKFGASFAWVTNTNQVCMTDPENILSKPGLEALIEASANVRLWSFYLEGTEFLALRIDAGTWVFSARSGKWSERISHGQANWIPQCYAGGVFGSAINGKTIAWGAGHLDLGGVLERRWRAGYPINSGGVMVNNVVLRVNPGQTPFLTGDYTDPVIEMRLSRDAGLTWGVWRSASMGAQGKYRAKLQWLSCGLASRQGFLAEFRLTAPVPLRVSEVLINETYGGM